MVELPVNITHPLSTPSKNCTCYAIYRVYSVLKCVTSTASTCSNKVSSVNITITLMTISNVKYATIKSQKIMAYSPIHFPFVFCLRASVTAFWTFLPFEEAVEFMLDSIWPPKSIPLLCRFSLKSFISSSKNSICLDSRIFYFFKLYFIIKFKNLFVPGLPSFPCIWLLFTN